MQHTFLQPKNALQRSRELLSVGQKEEALEILEQTLTHKKFRFGHWDTVVQEELAQRYVKLCIDLDRVNRDGLVQYRAYCHHQSGSGTSSTHNSSLQKVLVSLRTEAEQQLANALEVLRSSAIPSNQKLVAQLEAAADGVLTNTSVDSAAPLTSLDPEDALTTEYTAQPEALLLATIQAPLEDEASERYQSTLRLCLEVYRTILDLAKSAPKLEKVYHETCRRAYNLCRIHQRPSEFKRLCELTRGHYQSALRAYKQLQDTEGTAAAGTSTGRLQEFEALLQPELHIETRLCQLANATELRLWKENLAIMEDLYGMGILDVATSKAPLLKTKPSSRSFLQNALITYYAKLVELFDRTKNFMLLGHAMTRMVLGLLQTKALSPADFSTLSSLAVLTVLSVNQGQTAAPEDAEDPEEYKRLAMLQGSTQGPTVQQLIHMQGVQGILAVAFPEVRELLQIVETKDLDPYTGIARVQRLLNLIRKRFETYDAGNVAPTATQAAKDSANATKDAKDAKDAKDGVAKDATELSSFAQNVTSALGTLTPTTASYNLGSALQSFLKREPHVKRTLFCVLLNRLSEVYTGISMDVFAERICPPSFLTWPEAEQALTELVRTSDAFECRLDYAHRCICLSPPSGQLVDDMKASMNRLGHVLSVVNSYASAGEMAASRAATLSAVCSDMDVKIQLAQKTGAAKLKRVREQRNEIEKLKSQRAKDHEEIERARERRNQETELLRQKQVQDDRKLRLQKEDYERTRSEAAKRIVTHVRGILEMLGAKPSDVGLPMLGANKTLEHLQAQDCVSGKVTYKDIKQAIEAWGAVSKWGKAREKIREAKRVDHLARVMKQQELGLLEKWETKHEQDVQAKAEQYLKSRQTEESQRRDAILTLAEEISIATVRPLVKLLA